MRRFIVCPMDDTIEVAAFDTHTDKRIYGGLSFQTFTPPEPPQYPFVSAYFQAYNQQVGPLKALFRKLTPTFRPRSYLLVLHDDATDLEAHALSELLIACGAKDTLMEYRAFLLSSESAYVAITGSKRAVTVTLVLGGKEDTERIFIPINEATPDAVREAVHDLEPDGKLPVYAFGLKPELDGVGERVNTHEITRNFAKIV